MNDLASEIGPVPVGNEGKEFRKAVREDELIKEWKGASAGREELL